MIRRPPRSTHCISSAASDVYKRQVSTQSTWAIIKKLQQFYLSAQMAKKSQEVSSNEIVNEKRKRIMSADGVMSLMTSGIHSGGVQWTMEDLRRMRKKTTVSMRQRRKRSQSKQPVKEKPETKKKSGKNTKKSQPKSRSKSVESKKNNKKEDKKEKEAKTKDKSRSRSKDKMNKNKPGKTDGKNKKSKEKSKSKDKKNIKTEQTDGKKINQPTSIQKGMAIKSGMKSKDTTSSQQQQQQVQQQGKHKAKDNNLTKILGKQQDIAIKIEDD
eukprot:TRINITY_DN9424_c0_g1_i7.p1 TRINITY_DN9424_c0_g1~~TRINITY_DN9424_c0_g1_i7.p1  ORF type:complete len:270 (+),score=88.56 TRINITY_DN9424_c0_g1_i7:138-947(+)